MEWYTVGLECGKNVAEKVDKLIEKHSDNLKVQRKREFNGFVIYEWYMKWNPYIFDCDKELVDLLGEFDDGLESATDEEYYGNAYRLVAVGDEGSEDSYENDAGGDVCEDIYAIHEVKFPW